MFMKIEGLVLTSFLSLYIVHSFVQLNEFTGAAKALILSSDC